MTIAVDVRLFIDESNFVLAITMSLKLETDRYAHTARPSLFVRLRYRWQQIEIRLHDSSYVRSSTRTERYTSVAFVRVSLKEKYVFACC